MSTTTLDVRAVAQSGIAKLRAGDPYGARALLEQITGAGLADASIHHCLAQARGAMGDHPAALEAVDKALELKPANMYSLILKADLLSGSGDDRGATVYYKAALKAAEQQQVPPDMAGELRRAQAIIARNADKFSAHLVEKMAEAGLDDSRAASRFGHSLDLLLGKKQLYHPAPRFFYFPGLPTIQFWETDQFDWVKPAEEAVDAIRDELLEVLKQEGAFTPYVKNETGIPTINQRGLINNPAWSAFFLLKNGEIIPENASRCPRTMAALASVPQSQIPGRSANILFSLLRPGAHIPPHTGVLNTRLICHLPLIVPPNCGIRVGNETRQWVEGQTMIFDDTIEHEAWNRSDQMRIVLIYEAWRPELTDKEKTLVQTMFSVIDDYSGTREEWDN